MHILRENQNSNALFEISETHITTALKIFSEDSLFGKGFITHID